MRAGRRHRAPPRPAAWHDAPVGTDPPQGATAATWAQRTVTLAPRERGVHLVTRELLGAMPELAGVQVGLLHLFIRHTSASLALNEDASPDVRGDLEGWLRRAVPDGDPAYRHTAEGPDDMPAHVKAVLVGPALTLPVSGGRAALGTWQGVYLCEHRERGGARSVTLTLWGQPSA